MRKVLLVVALLAFGTASCVQQPGAAPPEGERSPAPAPVLRFAETEERLCREATQLRLRPLVAGAWRPGESAEWFLSPADGSEVLTSGTWSPEDQELFVAFPRGELLLPGEYRVRITLEEQEVGHYTFAVRGEEPLLEDVGLSLTPDGPAVADIDEAHHVFFVRYAFENVCPGSPLWIAVDYGEEPLCRRKITLEESEGQGVEACYRADGEPLEAGEYSLVITLMGEEAVRTAFRVGAEPVVESPPAPVCRELFTAMGLSPEGAPFRALSGFEWYTQVVYAGARCRDLGPDLRWEARWYRDGEPVRLETGRWKGQERGVVWDSLTGTEEAPFLPPGTYSLTLSLEGMASPLTSTFRVIPYVPPEERTP
ncbi:MAG: hypothetical protein ACLFU8_04540 [Anaerolineales bacterium]